MMGVTKHKFVVNANEQCWRSPIDGFPFNAIVGHELSGFFKFVTLNSDSNVLNDFLFRKYYIAKVYIELSGVRKERSIFNAYFLTRNEWLENKFLKYTHILRRGKELYSL